MKVLILRPEPKATELAIELMAIGVESFCWPAVDIVPESSNNIQSACSAMKNEDVAIVVSQFAAHLPKVPHTVISIGKGTAAVLKERGVSAIFPEGEANSEAVLGMEILQNVTDKNVWIFRGDHGRELISETLRERGANVIPVTCYYRNPPRQSEALLIQAWKDTPFDLVVATSLELAQNLWRALGSHQMLMQTACMTTVSDCMTQWAKSLGVATIRLPSASHKDVINVINKMEAGT